MSVFNSESDRGRPKEELCHILVSIRPNYAPKRQTCCFFVSGILKLTHDPLGPPQLVLTLSAEF